MKIESSKLEVCGGYGGDQGVDYGAAAPLRGEERSASGFRGAAILSPEVELPGGGKKYLSGGLLSGGKHNRFRSAYRGNICAAANAWKLIGTRDAQLRLCLEDAGGGDADIVILLNGGTN